MTGTRVLQLLTSDYAIILYEIVLILVLSVVIRRMLLDRKCKKHEDERKRLSQQEETLDELLENKSRRKSK